jgi:hypothetical protein
MLFITRPCLAFAGYIAIIVVAQAASIADPSDPATPVSNTPYESAFQTYQPAESNSMSPDKEWRAANAALANEPDHGGMGGMNMGESMQMPEPKTNKAANAMQMPKDMKMPMDKHPGMDMKMPMPMNDKDTASPMKEHSGHGKEK